MPFRYRGGEESVRRGKKKGKGTYLPSPGGKNGTHSYPEKKKEEQPTPTAMVTSRKKAPLAAKIRHLQPKKEKRGSLSAREKKVFLGEGGGGC